MKLRCFKTPCLLVFLLLICWSIQAAAGDRYYSGDPLQPDKVALIWMGDSSFAYSHFAWIQEMGKIKKYSALKRTAEVLPGQYTVCVGWTTSGYHSFGCEEVTLKAEPGHIYYITAEGTSRIKWSPQVTDMLYEEVAQKLGGDRGKRMQNAIEKYFRGDRREVTCRIMNEKDGTTYEVCQ